MGGLWLAGGYISGYRVGWLKAKVFAWHFMGRLFILFFVF